MTAAKMQLLTFLSFETFALKDLSFISLFRQHLLLSSQERNYLHNLPNERHLVFEFYYY